MERQAWLTLANQNPTITPQPVQMAFVLLPAPMPSTRVLVAGLVMSGSGQSQTNDASRALYNYTRLIGLDNKVTNWRVAHLSRPMPSGDNVGMLDGSGKWRKFKEMVPRSAGNVQATVWW